MTNAQRNRRWAAVMFAAISMTLAAAIAAPAQDSVIFTTVHSFQLTDGGNPYSALLQAFNGNLYGTTRFGGSGFGTIYEVNPNGILRTVQSFDGADGAYPYAALLQAPDGSIYGMADDGGVYGNGAVFRVSGAGTTALYSFCSLKGCTDGELPLGRLTQGADGDFYGTTSEGGASGHGTVFKITPQGTLTTLYSFCRESGCPDGAAPYSTLVLGTDGNFYGTTDVGGSSSCPNGCGTIFKVSRTGALTTMYSFCSTCTTGEYPYSGLTQGSDGNFYGTTSSGGGSHFGGFGTVFKMTPTGAVTALYSFCSFNGCPDGTTPVSGVIQGSDGNLYGTTLDGGSYFGNCSVSGCGTVFEITPAGSLTTLHTFGFSDGANPYGALVQDTNGMLYGTTSAGGCSNACNNYCGTVFGLALGLKAFVESVPALGRQGTAVTLVGTNLTGATSVTFNGIPATFTVESATSIKTTVPSGATTGPVQVVTPSSTLTSNVNFQVLP